MTSLSMLGYDTPNNVERILQVSPRWNERLRIAKNLVFCALEMFPFSKVSPQARRGFAEANVGRCIGRQ